jgi:UDP-glucose 4-epimerase
MSKVLVTGCAGFIMSHVCDHLIKNGHKVIGIDDLSGGFMENVPRGVTFKKADICDAGDIDRIFRAHKPDYVLHGAAYAAEGLSSFIRRYNYKTNVLGSMSLINSSVLHRVKGFVFLSSIATYGHQKPPFTERTPLSPADPYGIAKMTVELDLKAAHEMFGLKYLVLRPFNTYGPRQNVGDAYRNVVGIFMNQCLQNKPMTIFGDGEQTRAFSYVDDVAPVIAGVIDSPRLWGETFNLGGTHVLSVNALAELVAESMGVKKKVKYLPPRKEAIDAFCDTKRIVQLFHHLIRNVHPDEGIPLMAKWVKKHGARTTPKFAHIEITRNLPPSWAKL